MRKMITLFLLIGMFLSACSAIAPGAETKENVTTLVTTYVDSNHNGTWESPETALPGVLIAARSNIHGTFTYFAEVSDVEGKSYVTATYTHYFDLTAFTPCGYEPTTPTTVEAKKKNMFGFAPITPQVGAAELSMLLWHDENQDGEYQSGEGPIAGETLYLDPGLPWQYGEYDIFAGELTAQTDSGGDASVNLGNTCGDVTIAIPDGWLPSSAAKAGNWEDGKYKIAYQPGQTNIYLGVIPDPKRQEPREKTAQIQTFMDENRNGELDEGESNLPDVLIAAQFNIHTTMMRTAQISGADGRADITVEYTHRFDLTAITPCGYEPTGRVNIAEGQVPAVSLSGNIFEIGFSPVNPQAGIADLYILLWHDENQDSEYQSGEVPIAGEILYIDPGLPWDYDADILLGQLHVQTDSGGEASANLGNTCGELTVNIPAGWQLPKTEDGQHYTTAYQPGRTNIFLGVVPNQ